MDKDLWVNGMAFVLWLGAFIALLFGNWTVALACIAPAAIITVVWYWPWPPHQN